MVILVLVAHFQNLRLQHFKNCFSFSRPKVDVIKLFSLLLILAIVSLSFQPSLIFVSKAGLSAALLNYKSCFNVFIQMSML
jgi:hypothetical protein